MNPDAHEIRGRWKAQTCGAYWDAPNLFCGKPNEHDGPHETVINSDARAVFRWDRPNGRGYKFVARAKSQE